MIYLDDGSIVPVEKSELPIKLPHDVDLKKAETLLKITLLGKKLHIKVLENLQLEKPTH